MRRVVPLWLALAGLAIALAAGGLAGGLGGYFAGRDRAARRAAPEPEPVPEPVPQVAGNAPVGPAAVAPAKDRKYPLSQAGFKAVVWGGTRDQIIGKYGPPDGSDETAPEYGWDGPALIYAGPFSDGMGGKSGKAKLYFSRGVAQSVVGSVVFYD